MATVDRLKVKETHPDKNPGKDDSAFVEVQEGDAVPVCWQLC